MCERVRARELCCVVVNSNISDHFIFVFKKQAESESHRKYN